ncbi:MAG: DUF7793 family protein [Bacteroidia bacterium]
MEATTKIENEYVTLYLEDDILFGKYLTQKLDLEIAKNVLELQHRTFGYNVKYVITDLSNIKYVTKEARGYFTKEENTKNISAGAFIAPTLLHKIILTFFIAFNKPVVPTAFFTNLQDATHWIKKHQKAQQK